MADAQDTIIKEFLVTKLRGAELTGSDRANIYTAAEIQVRSNNGSPTVRIPNVVVGPYTSSYDIANASPTSKKLIFRI